MVASIVAAGQGFMDLSHWRKIGVGGADALSWLNDLITADISDLGPGRARQALLLSPTGQVRAQFTVAVPGSMVLIQDPTQAHSILHLLSRYVLSAEVVLDDRTEQLGLFAIPGTTEVPQAPDTTATVPSCLGRGIDLICSMKDRSRVARFLSEQFTRAEPEDVEAWRIEARLSRLGVDALEGDLPQEAGLDRLVSFDKGCYLGQETVARVRNLGHPRRLVIALEGSGPVSVGDPVETEGREVGRVTSAVSSDGRSVVLARVAWAGREGPFRTGAGTELRPAPSREGPG